MAFLAWAALLVSICGCGTDEYQRRVDARVKEARAEAAKTATPPPSPQEVAEAEAQASAEEAERAAQMREYFSQQREEAAGAPAPSTDATPRADATPQPAPGEAAAPATP